MADSIGKLQIELEARIAKFESDMGRAARIMQRDLVRAAQLAERALSQSAKRNEQSAKRLADSVSKDLARLKRDATQAGKAILGVFAVNLGAGMIRDLARVADGYANVQAKLRLVTQDQSQLGRVSEQVFQIAQRTYSSLDSTATLVSRTTRALVSNGATAEDALAKSMKLTETIQQAFAVSGATTAEASNAIIQLSQGLAAGALRGEEYNSVAEQGSRITQALAASLNVTTGELRDMAKEGALTAEVVQKALTDQAEAIAAEFAQLPLTIERSFQQLSNAFQRFVGEADAATGTSKEIAQSIQSIAANLPEIISLLTVAAKVAAAWFAVYRVGIPLIAGVGTAASKAAAGIVAMNVAQEMGIKVAGTWGSRLFAAVGGWPAVIIAAGAALYTLYDIMDEAEQRARAPITALEEINQKLRENVEAQKLAAEGVPQELQETVSLYRQNAESVTEWTRQLADLEVMIDSMKASGTAGFSAVAADAENLRDRIEGSREKMREFAILSGQTSTDVVADFRRIAGDGGAALADLVDKALKASTAIGKMFGVGGGKGATDAQVEFSKATQKAIDALNDQAATFGMTASKLTMYRAQQAAANEATEEGKKAILEAASALSAKQAAEEAATAATTAGTAATRAAAKEDRERSKILRELAREDEKRRKEMIATEDAARKLAEAQRELQQHFDMQARDIENEIMLLGLNTVAREQAIIALEAERLARDASGVVIEEQRKRYEALLTTLAASKKIEAAAREFENIWLRASDSVGDALTTALFDGADAGADAIKDVMKNLARDLVRFWMQQQIIIPLQQRMMGGAGGAGAGGMGGAMSAANGFTNGTYTGANTAFGSSFFGDSAGQWFGGNTGWSAAGNIAGGIAGIYGVWDTWRNGDGGASGALSGAMSGASAGTAIMPGIGTAVGAIIGALAGWFGGRDDPRIRVGDEWDDATASSRLDRVIGAQREGLPEGTATQFVTAIAEFDNTIAGMLDSYSGGQQAIERIQGALANWQMSLSGDAISIEGILEGRFGVILDQFDEDVRQFVMGAETLEEQVQRLGEVLVWPEQIEGLLSQFRNAELLSGMTELERQTKAVNDRFDELNAQFVAMNATTAQLEELERFRGIALAEVTGQLEGNTDALEANADVMREAAQQYAEFIDGFDQTGSPFQRSLRDLNREFAASTARANELAIAAGRQGARVEDLARIEADYMRAREASIADLTASIVDQIASLYGTTAQQLEQQLQALDAQIAGQQQLRQAGGMSMVVAISNLTRMTQERAALEAQLQQQAQAEEALRRQTGALGLAQDLADLTLARGIDFDTLASQLGLNLDRFGADLGLTADGVRELIASLEADSLTADAYGDGVQRIVDAILQAGAMRDNRADASIPQPKVMQDEITRGEDRDLLLIDRLDELAATNAMLVQILANIETNTGQTVGAIMGQERAERAAAIVGSANNPRSAPQRRDRRAAAYKA